MAKRPASLSRRGVQVGIKPKLLGWTGSYDFDFYATVLGPPFLRLVTRNRLLLALAFRVDAVGFDPFADQIRFDGVGTTLREAIVVLVGADAVGMSNRDDHFKCDALDLTDQRVEFCLPLWFDNGLVKIKEGVRRETHLFAGGAQRLEQPRPEPAPHAASFRLL